jgi:hypothetical protein
MFHVPTKPVPFHAHIYYSAEERPEAEALRQAFGSAPEILFVGSMPIGRWGRILLRNSKCISSSARVSR